jgi:aminopeptidase N
MNTGLKSFLIVLAALQVSVAAFADGYPRNYQIDMVHYAFHFTLSDKTDEMQGKAEISFICKKKDIRELRLDFINVTNDTKGKGMITDSVLLDGKPASWKHSNDALTVTWAGNTTEGAVMKLVIYYHGMPADGMRIGPNKYGDRTFFSENWPNKTRHWLPTVDHPYDKATCEFIVKAPVHYKVISNGLLLEETNIDASTRLTHWKQSVPIACWLFVLGVADFAVQYVDQVFGKSIQTWVYPKDRDAGFYDFAVPSKSVVQFYSDYVGPYAYEKLANVQATSHGGMETASAIFYAESMVNGKRNEGFRNVITHEIAHQWFGNAITESTWDDAWLSEGFATFFTQLYVEHAYGHDEFVRNMMNSRKSIYTYYDKDPDFSIVADRTAEKVPVTNVITYQKGAWFLHMLKDSIGNEKFQKGIRAYYQRFMNANATTRDFIDEMEKASGKNLQRFMQQWLYRSDNPDINGSWKYDAAARQVVVQLEQIPKKDFLFDMPVEVGVYQSGNPVPKITRAQLNGKTLTLNLSSDARPEKVVLDPRTVLLARFRFEEKQ